MRTSCGRITRIVADVSSYPCLKSRVFPQPASAESQVRRPSEQCPNRTQPAVTPTTPLALRAIMHMLVESFGVANVRGRREHADLGIRGRSTLLLGVGLLGRVVGVDDARDLGNDCRRVG